MRNILMLALLALGLVLVPAAGALADDSLGGTCPGGVGAPGTVVVYTDGGATPDDIVGVCVDGLGYTEIGADPGASAAPEAYVVAEEDSNGLTAGAGYIGVSNYESGDENNTCQDGGSNPEAVEGGTGTNSGGCYGTNTTYIDLRGGTLVNTATPLGDVGPSVDLAELVPLPVCGDDTGVFNDSTRDGCRADVEDVPPGV